MNGILYKGTDNKLHLYYWDLVWKHYIVPHSYSDPSLGYPGADYLNSGLVWDEYQKRLNYIGFDGRLQVFSYNPTLANWNHFWINDNWNNGDFCSYTSEVSTINRSSLVMDILALNVDFITSQEMGI